MQSSDSPTSPQTYHIRQVCSAEELDDVYRVRREVYINELGFHIAGSLADTGIVGQSIKQGLVLAAYDTNIPVGTVALGWWKGLDVMHTDIRHFQLAGFADAYSSASIVSISKWLVLRQYRGSRLALDLAKELFGFLKDKPEVRFCFIDSSPYLVRHYEALGFRHYAPPFQYDEGAVLSVPMCLVLGDFEHLSHIHSPMLLLLKRLGLTDRPDSREYFEKCWAPLRYGGGINLRDPSSYFPLTESEVIPENRVSQLFDGLSDSEVQLFCSHGSECTHGVRDVLLRRGEQYRKLLLLVDGYVELSREHDGKRLNIATLGPGNTIGEVEFLLTSEQSLDVRTLTTCTVLEFTLPVLKHLLEHSPSFAAVMYRNLSRILAHRVRASNTWITEAPPL